METKSNKSKSKSELGQFYTTNYDHILQNLTIPETEKNIIEPFAGKGHLLNFVKELKVEIQAYDIDINNISNNIIQRDTLKNPPEYSDKFILTNPPYLARNKSKEKFLFNKYNTNDLYKCFIKQIISDVCNGGIVIIPLNFWCSIRKADIELRRDFLEKYNVIRMNIFEEQVFDDTRYTTCSFLFMKRKNTENKIEVEIYRKNGSEKLTIELNSENNYSFGGHIYNLKQTKNIRVDRLTFKNMNQNKECITNILLKCIDGNTEKEISNNRIQMVMTSDSERYIDETPKLTARSFATLVISPQLNIKQQEKLVGMFNDYLETERKKYHSLFLTNYRENGRKRISFSLAFEIVNYLLNSKEL
jgi:hypothetical protein